MMFPCPDRQDAFPWISQCPQSCPGFVRASRKMGHDVGGRRDKLGRRNTFQNSLYKAVKSLTVLSAVVASAVKEQEP